VSRSERSKGARGEREVATILRQYRLPAVRTPNSGGLHIRGDLTGVSGWHFEVKRQETIRLPQWLRQAADECGDAVPVVAFRQSRGEWFATLPLHDLARLIDLERLTA
jgi:Holliday junction resolvase